MSEPWVPKPYQEEAVRFLIERAAAGLFLDPGLGKTSISLAAFKILKARDMVDATLVLCPLRPAYLVWPKEIQKWTEFSRLKFEILHGEDKAAALRRRADVYIINYDGLGWLAEELRGFRDWPFQMLLVDESSKVKHTNTLRFKILRPMLAGFRRRYILTGSPTARHLLDIFGQAYVMDRGASLGPYITKFREEYFYPTGYGGYQWAPKADAQKRIFKKLAPRVLRMAGEDYLKLPPITYNDVIVELPKEARRVYDQMENSLRADVESGRVVAANSGVASLKCRQIANGGIYTDPGRKVSEVLHAAKSDAVVELVEGLEGQPVLIAYDFIHDLERLRKALGIDVPYLGGGVSPKEAKRLEEAWNAGDLDVLLVHPESAAHGLNLQAGGRAVIWHSLTWNYENYDQLNRRVWRQGQKLRVVIHRVIAKDTVDEAIVASLKNKKGGQDNFFKALQDYWKGRKK